MKYSVCILTLLFLTFFLSGCLTSAIFDTSKVKVSENYYADFISASPIEMEYAQLGPFTVSYWEQEVPDSPIGKHEIWCPDSSVPSQGADAIWPMILVVNASNTPASQFRPLYKKLASWGFIVAGTEDKNTGTGETTAALLDYLVSEESPVHGKTDLNNLGIIGISQGGAGAIRAITGYENGRLYKTLVAISPAYPLAAKVMGWEYDASLLGIPVFLMAGTGFSDDTGYHEEDNFAGVCPLFSLIDTYTAITAPVLKVLGRIRGAQHWDMQRESDGYVTAWFRYLLQNDQHAGNAFTGETPEITINKRWKDVQCSTGEPGKPS